MTDTIKLPLLKLLNTVATAAPLELLITLSKQKLFLPFYHAISDEERTHLKHLFVIRTTKQFETDLDYLLTHYHPISAIELKELVTNSKPIPKKCFFLSFDDGLSEVYHVIAPILKQKGIPAMFFLNPAFINNKALFYRSKSSILIEIFNSKNRSKAVEEKTNVLFAQYGLLFQKDNIKASLLKIDYSNRMLLDELATVLDIDFADFLLKQQPYLTTEQIKKLQHDGFTIGAHSMDHPEYTSITNDEQLKQTKESIDYLHNNFAVRDKFFAFPFTDYGIKREFFEQLFDSHNPIVDVSFGCAGLKKDSFPMHLQRFAMDKKSLSATTMIKTEYLYYLLKIPFGKNQILR